MHDPFPRDHSRRRAARIHGGALEPGLSQQASPNHRQRRPRWRRRHRNTDHCGQAARTVGPAVRGREPAGRRRQYRRRSGVPVGRRRLHPAGVFADAARDQRLALQEAQLRSGGIRAGRDDVADPQCAGGPAGFFRQIGAGGRRGRKSQSGQIHLRITGDRHRVASHRRAVHDAHWHQAGARSLQGQHRQCADRRGRRPRRPELHPISAVHEL